MHWRVNVKLLPFVHVCNLIRRQHWHYVLLDTCSLYCDLRMYSILFLRADCQTECTSGCTTAENCDPAGSTTTCVAHFAATTSIPPTCGREYFVTTNYYICVNLRYNGCDHYGCVRYRKAIKMFRSSNKTLNKDVRRATNVLNRIVQKAQLL